MESHDAASDPILPIATEVRSDRMPSQKNTPIAMTLDEKQDRLQALAQCVSQCVRCQELAETRTQTVFGVGDPNANIMFIGEAPGADEDREGEPFVGRAGQLLNKIIEACQMKREEIYICNILRCRPPGNRNPTPAEAGNCREYLDGQIEIVQPEYIVCWGSVAAKNLLGTDTPIGKMRGKFYEHAGAKVLCTYHPSYLLRNPPAKKDVWEDLKFLFREMGITLE
jgi:DNA polymerase